MYIIDYITPIKFNRFFLNLNLNLNQLKSNSNVLVIYIYYVSLIINVLAQTLFSKDCYYENQLLFHI